MDVIKKFDSTNKIVSKIVDQNLIPLYETYIKKLNLNEL